MRQKEEGLLLGRDLEWRWGRAIEENGDCRVNGRHYVVIVSSLEIPVEAVAQDRDVGEMVSVMTPHFLIKFVRSFFSMDEITALDEVTPDVFFHDVPRLCEGRT